MTLAHSQCVKWLLYRILICYSEIVFNSISLYAFPKCQTVQIFFFFFIIYTYIKTVIKTVDSQFLRSTYRSPTEISNRKKPK